MRLFHLVPSVLMDNELVDEKTDNKIDKLVKSTFVNKEKLPADVQNQIINSALRAKSEKTTAKKTKNFVEN